MNRPQHIIPVFSSVYLDFFYGYQGQALVFRSISVYQLVVPPEKEGLAFGMLGLLTVLVWVASIVPTWAVLDVHVSIYSLHVLTISSSAAPEIHMVR